MHPKWAIVAQSLRLPSICALCHQFHSAKLAICLSCIQLMPSLGENCCQHCARPLADDHYSVCGQCIKKQPHFDRSFIHYQFEEPLRSLLHEFKYYQGLYLCSFFAHTIEKAIGTHAPLPQCLIPVPMHPKKIKQRGYNQAAILVQSLAKKLKLPYDLLSCKKIINTQSQADLNGEQRRKNLRQAFIIKKMGYHHVALVDDLLTTGATANELARVLKQSGIKQVDLWCCARTMT